MSLSVCLFNHKFQFDATYMKCCVKFGLIISASFPEQKNCQRIFFFTFNKIQYDRSIN